MEQVIYMKREYKTQAQRAANAPQMRRSEASLKWDKKAPGRTPHSPLHKTNPAVHAKFWKYDARLRDYFPINRPCDYCDEILDGAFLCDPCADYTVARWEYTEDTQASDLLILTALKGKRYV